MANNLRGDGLARVHRALDRLDTDPLGLDRARMRFSQSPPPYTSNSSGTTTRSASPDTRSDEQRRRERRRYQLIEERAASLPQEQFEAEVKEEERRIWKADPRTRMHTYRSIDLTFEEDARETVKKRWIEQGIWKNKWDDMADGLWKHEEPLELESELETDIEAVSPPHPFSFGTSLKPPPSKSRQPKSDEEKRRIAERQAIQEREREASRPYYQFVYQISKERERIQDESTNREGADAAGVNTRAYENVKNTWTKRGIWNRRWGILPGLSWKHEWPLEEEAADSPALVPENLLMNGSHEAREAPAIRIFGSPPVESNHHQPSGALSASQQGPPADIDPAGLENGDAERSSTSTSPPPSSRKRVLHPTTGQAMLPSKRKASHKGRQAANAALGPVHSKAAIKKKPGPQRRLNVSQKVSSDGLSLSSDMDVAESQPLPSPDPVAPRRSKRIQPPVLSISKDLTKMASTNTSKRAVRSKPERNVTSNLTARSSAKPQGISKKQSMKSPRGRARRK